MRAIMLRQDSSVNPCVFRSLSGRYEEEELHSDHTHTHLPIIPHRQLEPLTFVHN